MSVTPSNTVIALVALMKLRGVGRRAALRTVDCALTSESSSEARDVAADRVGRAKQPVAEFLDAWSRTQDELTRGIDMGVEAFALHDDAYPARLRGIPDPPAVLYVKGKFSALHTLHSLAVIGTREPTAYGEKVARKLAASAVDCGFMIVSGLAHGCDTLAHEGCLDAHGIGVAVLAHGLDKLYPAANRGLATRLLDNQGCLVSEYPVGMVPMRTAFAERDRIQSGLSDGVLVVETDVKGGTMHTVKFAGDQKRPLACIEHPANLLEEDKTRGNQLLIADKRAEAIPDGDALKRFLDRLKAIRAGVVRVSEEPKSVNPQLSMGF